MKFVVIDMNAQFKDVAELCFPNATIVIDRFHVTRQALWAMERVRKTEQKALPAAWRKFFMRSRYLLFTPQEELKPEEREKLRRMLGLSTKLELAYDLKNDFLEMMHAPNSKAAAERMAD